MYSKTQVRFKFYLHKILQFKKSVEAQGFLILPSYDCFTISQEKLIENELIERGIIKETRHGGDWNEEGFFNKNQYEVDWNQLDVEYNGWLRSVPYVNLIKEWEELPIERKNNNVRYLKDEDLVISSHIGKKIPAGLTPSDLRDCLNAKYVLKSEIDKMLIEVNPHLVVENKSEFTITIGKKKRMCENGDILDKVGYRVTNSLVGLKKADGSRDRFLKENGLFKQLNGDIKSEIPRVTRLIHTGEWLPFSFDFYSHYVGKDTIDPKLRSFIKSQNMPLYFTNWSSPASFSARQYLSLQERSWRDKEFEFNGFVGDNVERLTRLMLEKIKEGFDREVGQSLNSAIFLYTSWIETRALQILVRKFPNAKFFQVYDEIFSNEDCGDLELIYKQAANELYVRTQLLKDIEQYNKDDVNKDDNDSSTSSIDSNSSNFKLVEEFKSSCFLNHHSDIDIELFHQQLSLLFNNDYTLVNKLANLNSSTNLKFDSSSTVHTVHTGYIGNKNALGHNWSLTEEQKEARRVPKSEEMKAKLKVPKSEESNRKRSDTLSEALNLQVEYVRTLITNDQHLHTLKKKRQRQQYIDQKVYEKFGKLSAPTLIKIRKLASS